MSQNPRRLVLGRIQRTLTVFQRKFALFQTAILPQGTEALPSSGLPEHNYDSAIIGFGAGPSGQMR